MSTVINDNSNESQLQVPQQEPYQSSTEPQPRDSYNVSLPCFGSDPCLLAYLVVYIIGFLVFTIYTNNVWGVIVSFAQLLFLSFLPTYLIWKYTMRYLNSEGEISRRSIINLFLKSLILLSFFIVTLVLIVFAVVFFAFIGTSVWMKFILSLTTNTNTIGQNTDFKQLFLDEFKKIVPLHKALLISLGIILFLTVVIEETGKWILTNFSVKLLNKYVISEDEQQKQENNIKINSMLVIAIFSSLGVAASQNIPFPLEFAVFTLSRSTDAHWIINLVMTVIRHLLVFPLHIGCTLIVILNLYYSKVYRGLLIAISFHFLFESIDITLATLKFYHVISGLWIDITVLYIQVVLIIILVVILAIRLNPLIARRQIIEDTEPV